MGFFENLKNIVGDRNVIFCDIDERYCEDWYGAYQFQPLAVVRPADTSEVSKVVNAAYRYGIPIVPMSGNTGLAGGTSGQDSLILSLERMNKILSINPISKLVKLEAGVVLSFLHEELAKTGSIFPVTFGARGSAMIGGILSTNAGGSNVLRYGNTRTLCLGLEVVLPDGQILDLMSELYKDNSGFDIRQLIIGAEGTLGIITRAVLRTFPKPMSYSTAVIAVPSIPVAIDILNRLQKATGNAVEAFEYMPASYMKEYFRIFPDVQNPMQEIYEINIFLELGWVEDDSKKEFNAENSFENNLENLLSYELDKGLIIDATLAQNEMQRRSLWDIREAAAEVTVCRKPVVNNDIAVPINKVAEFLELVEKKLSSVETKAPSTCVAHLGDGNLHYWIWPKNHDSNIAKFINTAVENVAVSLGGSFSAEHGIGVMKLDSMSRNKSPVAIEMMQKIKTIIDPKNIMNPGKVIPEKVADD